MRHLNRYIISLDLVQKLTIFKPLPPLPENFGLINFLLQEKALDNLSTKNIMSA